MWRARAVGLGMLAILASCNNGDYWLWADEAVPSAAPVAIHSAEIDLAGRGRNLDVFNPGMADFGSQRFVALRVDRKRGSRLLRRCRYERTIALTRLGADHQPYGAVTTLPLPGDAACKNAEDGRLIEHDGSLYVVYNAEAERTHKVARRWPIRMHVAELDVSNPDEPVVRWSRRLLPPEAPANLEKNWSPFSADGSLYFIQNSMPHVVLEMTAQQLAQAKAEALTQAGAYGAVTLQQVPSEGEPKAPTQWQAGEWRGGTPGVYEPSLDQYVSFFHSYLSVGKTRLYYAGCYTFAAAAPFAPASYVPAPIALPIVSHHRHRRWRVVFPMGLVSDGNQYLLSYGQDDKAAGVVAIDKASLFSQLVPFE